MPYIYKIINKVNNKVYIGKTLLTPEKRFKEHIIDSRKINNEKRPLYSTMKKYGTENFYVVTVEECDKALLNEREKYWIEYFGSFKDGYNATVGGDGKPYLDYELIYKTYIKTKSIKETAKIIPCSPESVSKVLSIYNIDSEIKIKNANMLKSKKVAMLDKNTGQILKVFPSIKNACDYLQRPFSGHISAVCNKKRKTAYGYKWEYL